MPTGRTTDVDCRLTDTVDGVDGVDGVEGVDAPGAADAAGAGAGDSDSGCCRLALPLGVATSLIGVSKRTDDRSALACFSASSRGDGPTIWVIPK